MYSCQQTQRNFENLSHTQAKLPNSQKQQTSCFIIKKNMYFSLSSLLYTTSVHFIYFQPIQNAKSAHRHPQG